MLMKKVPQRSFIGQAFRFTKWVVICEVVAGTGFYLMYCRLKDRNYRENLYKNEHTLPLRFYYRGRKVLGDVNARENDLKAWKLT